MDFKEIKLPLTEIAIALLWVLQGQIQAEVKISVHTDFGRVRGEICLNL